MRKTLLTLTLVTSLALAACTDTTGLSEASSRTPAGNPQSGITVTEYADLQCPACRTALELVNKPLLEKYGTKVRFVFKHFPLRSLHIYAFEAAQASECAADQGKFWEFLDVNYTKQDELSRKVFSTWAEELSLDVPLFDRCLASGIKKKTVMADYDEGKAAGVQGTPTYFVNGIKVPSTTSALYEAIDKALAGNGVRL